MPAQPLPPPIWTIAQALKQCVLDQVQTDGSPAPEESCVIAGQWVWEDKCLCGYLVINIMKSWPSDQFPRIAQTTTRCGTPKIVWQLSATLLRCTPVSKDQFPPSCTDLEASALQQVIDSGSLKNGIECCLAEMLNETDPVTHAPVITDWATGNITIQGPQGGCGGPSFDIMIGLLNRCPC